MDENVPSPGVSAVRRRRGCNGRKGPNTSPVGCGFRRERVTRVVLDNDPLEGELNELASSSDGNVVDSMSGGDVSSVCRSGGGVGCSGVVCKAGGRVGGGEDGVIWDSEGSETINVIG